MSLHPYIVFTNTAREAMTRHQGILGGTGTDRFGVSWMVNVEAVEVA